LSVLFLFKHIHDVFVSVDDNFKDNNFLKRSAPETPDSTDNDVHSKKKKDKYSKKNNETKHIRKFQPAWLKEFN